MADIAAAVEPGLGRALRELVDGAFVGIACLDAQTEVVYANAAFVQATGVGPAGKLRAAHAPAAGRLADAVDGVVRTGHSIGDLEVDDGGGRSWVARVWPLAGSRIAIVLVDATDRTALRESEQRFVAFMDNSPAISFMVDGADRAVYLSKPYLRAFGFGAEMIGRSAWELFPPEFVEQYLGYMHHARDVGEIVTVCVPAPREDGVGYFLAHYFPMPETSGSLVGGVAIDVTELMRTRDALALLSDQQAALRRVATLVAREPPEEQVFAAVTEEVAGLLQAQTANMVRFEDGERATVVGRWSESGTGSLPVGERLRLDGESALAAVWSTRETARIDRYDGVAGSLAATARELGLRSSVAAPVMLQNELWGAVVASTTRETPLAADAEARLREFAELVAQAIANSQARAELAASRRRIVAAADDARRRIERDLHDGAQQRLVTHSLTLRLARAQLRANPDEAERLLDRSAEEISLALQDLRQLARGIHPAVLSERGLAPAITALAARAPLPVEILELPTDRLPATAETTAYFTVAEALTNVAKYARASHATVRLAHDGDTLAVEVRDDGVGGASPTSGSGLSGLADRLGACEGSLSVDSPPDGGTLVRAVLPLQGAHPS